MVAKGKCVGVDSGVNIRLGSSQCFSLDSASECCCNRVALESQPLHCSILYVNGSYKGSIFAGNTTQLIAYKFLHGGGE